MSQNLEKLTAYEILEKRQIKDLNSEGYLLKHKRTGAHITLLLMMMRIRYFILALGHRQRTARGLPISWSIPYFAVLRIFR